VETSVDVEPVVTGVNCVVVAVVENNVIVEVRVEVDAVVIGVNWVAVTVEET
jgi:hypothetical protein